MKFLLTKVGQLIHSIFLFLIIYRDPRELKRGGTAPGESRKNKN